MAQFKAQAGQRYKSKATGQEVVYDQAQLDTPGGAIGFLSTDYEPVNASNPKPTTPTPKPTAPAAPGSNAGQSGGANGPAEDDIAPTSRPVLDLGDEGGSNYYQEPEKPDYEAIRKQEIDRAQAMIDATQGLYDQEVARITREGEGDLKRASSTAVGAGLAGSPFQATVEDPVKKATERELKAEQQRRQAYIAELMGKGDAEATRRYEKERDMAAADRKNYVDEQKANQEEFRAILANAASQGYSYSELTPEQKAIAKQRSGFDDFGLEVYLNANKPKAEQKDITYQTVGNKVIGYYTEFDANGKPSIKSFESEPMFDMPQGTVDYNVQMASDGTMLLIPKTFDPNVPVKDQIVEYGNYAKAEEAGKGGDEYDPNETVSVDDMVDLRAQGFDVRPGMTYGDLETLEPGLTEDEIKDAKKEAEAREADKAKVGELQEKVTLIDSLLNHKGMKGSVGSYGIARWTPFSADKSARQEFAAGVNQLISQETVDTLLALKAQGGTLGALSNEERQMLQSAATKIGTWMKRDDNGNPTGKFEVSEAAFKKELETLKRLTQTAIENASGGGDVGGADDPLGIGTEADPLGLGFNPAPSTALKGSKLGALSAKYESSGDPGIVGWDAVGGTSYGTYQLIPSNANKFASNSKYAPYFKGQQAGTPEFKKTWKRLAEVDPKGFAQAQEQFIQQTHYDPQVKRLASKGYDISKRSDVVRQVVWSTAVQHGANTDVVEQAFKKVGKNATDAELIDAIYNERWSGGRRFASSNAQVKQAVKNRFVQERKLALSQLRNTA